MKTLKTILATEKKNHSIVDLAKSFGFTNVKLFFEKNHPNPELNIIVDNIHTGKPSWDITKRTRLLEYKLTAQLKIGVAVIASQQVTDPFHFELVKNGSIAIINCNEKEIENFLDCKPEEWTLKETDIDEEELKLLVKSADEFISESQPINSIRQNQLISKRKNNSKSTINEKPSSQTTVRIFKKRKISENGILDNNNETDNLTKKLKTSNLT